MLRRVHLSAQLVHVLAGFLKQLFQPLFAAKTAGSGTQANAHSVLAHAADPHHILVHQRRDHLREKRIQRRAVIGAEIRQKMMIDADPAAQPAKGRAVFTTTRQLARRTDAANACVEPQRHQQLRIGRVAARLTLAGLDRLVEPAQVQLLHYRLHHANRVPGIDQIVRAGHHHGHLTPLGLTQTNRCLFHAFLTRQRFA